jgi:enamine deaminase RidA (YjgF/YER057c/UK114 family)
VTYEYINPEELGATKGWTNGMLAPKNGRIMFIAGQDAAEPNGEVTSDDFVEQFGIVMEKICTVVREAGGGPEDIGRLLIFVTDLDSYRAARRDIGRAYRAHMGKHYPAMALMEVSRLLDPRALVEIEGTAVIPDLSA